MSTMDSSPIEIAQIKSLSQSRLFSSPPDVEYRQEELLHHSPIQPLKEHFSATGSTSTNITDSSSDFIFHPFIVTEPIIVDGAVLAKVEDMLENMADCLLGEKKELVINLKTRSGASATAVKFPGKTPKEAWKFSMSSLSYCCRHS
jgi:hypothetical protein